MILKALRALAVSIVSTVAIFASVGAAQAAPSFVSGAGTNATCDNFVNVNTSAKNMGSNQVGAALNCTTNNKNLQSGLGQSAGANTKSQVEFKVNLKANGGVNALGLGVNTTNNTMTTQKGAFNGAGSSLSTLNKVNVNGSAYNGGSNGVMIEINNTNNTTVKQ